MRSVLTAAPTSAPSEIAGFWQRIFALVTDGILLGIVGWCIGLAFFSRLVEIGSAGRIIGFAITLAYFGTLNSRLGGGATVGKRLFKLRVAGRNGEPTTVARSVLRTIVYSAPFYLNGLDLSFLPAGARELPSVEILIATIVFGGVGSIFYLYIANSTTRQSLHDLIAGTFVVRVSGLQHPVLGRIWFGHILIVVLWFLIVIVGTTLGLRYLDSSFLSGKLGIDFEALQKVEATLNSDPRIRTTVAATETVTTVGADGGPATALTIVVKLRNTSAEPVVIADQIATRIFKQYPDLLGQQGLTITVRYGFDIGIASGWRTFNYPYTHDGLRIELRTLKTDRST